jgi:micrococcal nuclease
MTPAAVYLMTILRVVDGDTVVVHTPWVGSPIETVDLRVAGIDTPEKSRPLAKCVAEIRAAAEATRFTKTLLTPGEQVSVVLTGKDKYFRLLGGITLPDGRDYGAIMVSAGYARPYNGGKKSSWCPAALKR